MNVEVMDVVRKFRELRATQHIAEPWRYRENVHKHADAYLKWCAKERLDPLRFLEYLFACAAHAGHVVHASRLRSAKLAEHWRQWAEGQRLQQEHGEALERKAGTRAQQMVKELRVLTPGMEAVKQPYVAAGKYELCVAQPDLTGGFHPESIYCPRCPRAVECAARLYHTYGFDVVSLRAGRLQYLPAEIAAAAVR